MWTKALCHFSLMTELEKIFTTEPDKSQKSGHLGVNAIRCGTQNFENRYCMLSVFLLHENPSSTNNSLVNSSLCATNE